MAYKRQYQYNMFEEQFQYSLDPTHELVVLSERIDWQALVTELVPYYSKTGRRAKSIRLMVGLLILKHRYALSDEQVVSHLHENVYWMKFCGMSWHPGFGPPHFLESSVVTKFRRRLGEEGMRKVEEVIRDQLTRERQICPRTQLVDTTAMEKHIRYPTDSDLLHRGRAKLTRVIKTLKKYGIGIDRQVRSYTRLSKREVLRITKLGKGRAERIREGTLKLADYAKSVVKEVPSILEECERYVSQETSGAARAVVERLVRSLKEGSEILERVIHQAEERFRGNHVKRKIYSLHEPEVVCIRKGKRGKPNEYGSKVLISIDRNGYVVAHREYMSNPADSELLEDAVSDWQEACGVVAHEVGADRGFSRSSYAEGETMKEVDRWSIPTKGKKPHPDADTFWFQRLQRKRTGIEAVIGHLKTDHGMDRCRYKGFEGDIINGCLVAIAWNLRKWSKVLCPG